MRNREARLQSCIHMATVCRADGLTMLRVAVCSAAVAASCCRCVSVCCRRRPRRRYQRARESRCLDRRSSSTANPYEESPSHAGVCRQRACAKIKSAPAPPRSPRAHATLDRVAHACLCFIFQFFIKGVMYSPSPMGSHPEWTWPHGDFFIPVCPDSSRTQARPRRCMAALRRFWRQ